MNKAELKEYVDDNIRDGGYTATDLRTVIGTIADNSRKIHDKHGWQTVWDAEYDSAPLVVATQTLLTNDRGVGEFRNAGSDAPAGYWHRDNDSVTSIDRGLLIVEFQASVQTFAAPQGPIFSVRSVADTSQQQFVSSVHGTAATTRQHNALLAVPLHTMDVSQGVELYVNVTSSVMILNDLRYTLYVLDPGQDSVLSYNV